MRKVPDTVRDLLLQDEVAFEALRRGVLNLSAYAQSILPQVEAVTWKTVKPATIVVALSRMADEVKQLPSTRNQLRLDDVSIKSPLTVLSFEKTEQNIDHLRQLNKQLHNNPNQFIVATQGSREITIIMPGEYESKVRQLFDHPPKAHFSHMVGVTVSFSEKYLAVPNIIYTILSVLAVHHINIIEIVSTYTELTIIIDQKEMDVATRALQGFFQNSD